MRLPFFVLSATLAAASTLVLAAPASADLLFGRRNVYEGRWCAQMNTGAGRIEEDCRFDSFERCRQMIIAGNRGFCTQNPAYRPAPPVARKAAKRRIYREQ